jgi:large subunit ribosomal protein L17
MLANMACSLIEHKRINTTLAKAKALKVFVEPLITKAKAENNQSIEKGTHNRRIVFSQLRDKETITELFSTVSEKVGDRPGGYTRIIKLGNRMGDNADMAMIELVDFNELYNADKPKAKKTRRKKKADAPAEAAPKAEAEQAPVVAEAPEVEEAPETSSEEQENKGQDA